MKKQLLVSAATVLALVGVVGCSGYDKTVKADTETTWVVHGQCKLDADTVNGWNGKEKELYEKSKLTATSIEEVSKISEDVAKQLANKEVVYLYTIDIILGENDAGWTTNCIKADGKKYTVNGSYAFKVAKVTYEAADETYAEQQWIPDPKTAHVESLTPSTYFVPTWKEQPDDKGFSWASNPVCIGGAGTYTVIAAQYKAVSSDSEAGYGIGLVKKAEGTAATEDKEVVDFIAKDHTYGLIGSFGTSDWKTDTALVANEAKTEWSVTVELKAGDQFKVRADGDWTYNWGISEGDYAHLNAEGKADGNGVVSEDGTYKITLSNVDLTGAGKVTVTKVTA